MDNSENGQRGIYCYIIATFIIEEIYFQEKYFVSLLKIICLFDFLYYE